MLVGLVSKFGTKVTLMEVVNAGGASGTPGGLATATGVGELLSVAGGLVASLYLGTVIGSLVVAVDKTYMGDNGDKLTTNLADLYYKADQVMKGGIPKWLKDIMERQTATQSGAAKVPSQKKGSHHLKNPI